MRLWLTKDPKIALMMIPWFVENDQTRKELYLELRYMLTYRPADTFLCLAMRGKLIQGMIIAYHYGKETFIWQASGNRRVKKSVVDAALDGVRHWARSKGCSRITCVTTRSKKAFKRRFGFKQSKENKKEMVMEI